MFRRFNPRARFHEIELAANVPHAPDKLDVDARFPRLLGLQDSASALLARQRVVVVGVGSVGRRIAMHLARQGIEALWLIDPDRYDDRANLVTQEILATDLGDSKSESTGKACKEISLQTQVFVYEGKLQELDPLTMATADTVFLSADNLAAEIDASHLFRLLGIPLVQASVHGETLVAQVRFVENQCADRPCLICSYGPGEYRHLNQSSVFRCTRIGTGEEPSEQIAVIPTTSTSFLCSLAADFATTQWARYVLSLGQPVADTLLQYCGFNHRLTQTNLDRNENCKSGHLVLERSGLPKKVTEHSACDLVRSAGFGNGTVDDASLTLGSLSYVASAVCRCDRYHVRRFLANEETMGQCKKCGQPITAEPYFTTRPTPVSELKSHWDRRLKDLGGEPAAWAVVHGRERGVLLHEASSQQSSSYELKEEHHEA